jgi:hypothetical protein
VTLNQNEAVLSTFFWSTPKQNVKNLNKHAVIDLIRFTPNGISRVELARELNLTRAAVTSIINDLQDIGMVLEVEGSHPAGRKPIVLEINPDRGYVLGIDLGATHAMLLLANYAAHVVKEIERPIDINQGPEIVLRQVDGFIKEMLEDTGLNLLR